MKNYLYEINLDEYKIRVENDDLGITILDSKGNTVCWLNRIGTAVLKKWLQGFDPTGRMNDHPSVKEILLQNSTSVKNYMEMMTKKEECSYNYDYEGL